MKAALSVSFLPNAVYQPKVCMRTTLETARATGFPSENTIFKVTEGERAESGVWFAQILRECKHTGFKTAIDDFGAGFAGLKLQSNFQLDIIKIDTNLVRHINRSFPRQAIVRGLIRLRGDGYSGHRRRHGNTGGTRLFDRSGRSADAGQFFCASGTPSPGHRTRQGQARRGLMPLRAPRC